MKCINCKSLIKKEDISLMSQLIGYTAECSKTGILFNIEKISEEPDWCPLLKSKKQSGITDKP